MEVILTADGTRPIEDHFDRNVELESFLEQKREHYQMSTPYYLQTMTLISRRGDGMVEKRTARDIMTAPVITATEDMLLPELIKIMASNQITGMPVVDENGYLSGMISWRLIMNMAIMDEITNMRVLDAMSKQLETYGPTCTLDTPVEKILKHFSRYRINRMVVVDDCGLNSTVLGIICRRDVIGAMNRIYNGR